MYKAYQQMSMQFLRNAILQGRERTQVEN